MEFYDSEFRVRGPLLGRGEVNGVWSMRRHSAGIHTASAKGIVVNGWEGGRTPPK